MSARVLPVPPKMGLSGDATQGPAYSRIAIGAVMGVGEGVVLGHGLEQAKIVRQATGLSYIGAVRHAYNERGLVSVLYRGFFPYGALQALTKGLPILFVEAETKRLLEPHLPKKTAALLAGISGGVVQGAFVAPTQRLKTLTMTYGGTVTGWRVAVVAVQKEGFSTLFRGTPALALRRGIDWGIRFSGLAWLKPHLELWSGGKRDWHQVAGAFFGGALSAVTLPLDNIIANMQKSGSRGGMIAIGKQIFAERGFKGFTNGFVGRVVHSGYHTAFVAGGGAIVYDYLKARNYVS
eukprot:m.373626 g.373626  ORF g.373626 m.373626 type:complete len:293 (-) comp56152_c0_seq5:230-1108(-)